MNWWEYVLLVVLIVLSGVFSGLTLGLMGLDTTLLQVIADGGDDVERANAQKILPMRESGNLLLCTLLIGNTLVNTCISILMNDLAQGPVAIAAATAVIVVFGEISPQAVCSRHGLAIGAKVIPLVQLFTVRGGASSARTHARARAARLGARSRVRSAAHSARARARAAPPPPPPSTTPAYTHTQTHSSSCSPSRGPSARCST